MLKEIIKELYLIYLALIYWIIKLVTTSENKVLIIYDFENDIEKFISKKHIKIKNTDNIYKILYLIAKNDIIISDNYNFYFVNIKISDKTIIQIWHAKIAIKKIGLISPKNKKRNKLAKRRFKKVYDTYDFYLCSSKHMRDVFINSFEQDKSKMIEFNFNKIKINNNLKKQILYAPTFRDELNDKQIEFVKYLKNNFSDYDIKVKLHPKIDNQFEVIEIEEEYSKSEFLITDYSSVAYEFGYYSDNLLFYIYDYQEYLNNVGLNIKIDELENVFRIPEKLNLENIKIFNFQKLDYYKEFDVNSYDVMRGLIDEKDIIS